MPWDYPTLLIMLGEETLPALVRSRYYPMSLKYEPASEPLHISVKQLFIMLGEETLPALVRSRYRLITC